MVAKKDDKPARTNATVGLPVIASQITKRNAPKTK
jgi:hypothetical protein